MQRALFPLRFRAGKQQAIKSAAILPQKIPKFPIALHAVHPQPPRALYEVFRARHLRARNVYQPAILRKTHAKGLVRVGIGEKRGTRRGFRHAQQRAKFARFCLAEHQKHVGIQRGPSLGRRFQFHQSRAAARVKQFRAAGQRFSHERFQPGGHRGKIQHISGPALPRR